MADNSSHEPLGAGRRKDGMPYKAGNTREDGSFSVGKGRTPEETRFKKGDGRRRGTRGKGTKNLVTEWREELEAKIEITEGGEKRKVTKRRALIKSQIARGMSKSDRAAETVLKYAELSERREPGLQEDDHAIIEAWLCAMSAEPEGSISDDLDVPPQRSPAEEELGVTEAGSREDGDA